MNVCQHSVLNYIIISAPHHTQGHNLCFYDPVNLGTQLLHHSANTHDTKIKFLYIMQITWTTKFVYKGCYQAKVTQKQGHRWLPASFALKITFVIQA